ncbi:MAG TPA: heat-inducible transcriptional repressor HrcA [Thermoanaerobaculia bacterium]|nr:heat-inducible transcriptional repressor HrcA [Thermoanaerobaculia bacterium]
MARPKNLRELSERDREILKAVILCYVMDAEPVGSRSVAKRSDLGLSPATIRNVMADLEEAGLLVQPHTSAGRVPTPAAYHLFIESMMRREGVPPRIRRYIEENLRAVPGDPGDLMEAASHLLSELTHQVGIVVTPVMGDTVLKQIELVPLSGRRVLAVVVSASGFVDNKVLETDQEVPRDTLTWISNYLNEHFAGLTLREIRDRLLAAMAEERAQVDRLLGLTLELAQKGFQGGDDPRVLLDGASTLLAHPELADIDRVRRLFDLFTNQAQLVKLLSQCIEGDGVRVTIGEESDLTSPFDFSLVSTSYRAGGETRGTLGIFGPSRMEYQKVVPLVHYLGETLSRALGEVYGQEH